MGLVGQIGTVVPVGLLPSQGPALVVGPMILMGLTLLLRGQGVGVLLLRGPRARTLLLLWPRVDLHQLFLRLVGVARTVQVLE